MSRLIRTRSARSVAAAAGALGLVVTGFAVAESRVADRRVLELRNEAPAPAATSGQLDEQTRQRLADIQAQRYADLTCSGIAYPQRAC
jgi:hypothetical protein